jgi:hypothetical protein
LSNNEESLIFILFLLDHEGFGFCKCNNFFFAKLYAHIVDWKFHIFLVFLFFAKKEIMKGSQKHLHIKTTNNYRNVHWHPWSCKLALGTINDLRNGWKGAITTTWAQAVFFFFFFLRIIKVHSHQKNVFNKNFNKFLLNMFKVAPIHHFL